MKFLGKWEAFALLLCAVIGLLSVPFPFHGDQAMFMMAAKKLEAGGVLYRDFWDFKQPGIYWFFMTGGKLFGFTEVGVHALECIYMLLGSLAVLVILRRRLTHQWIAACSAVLFAVWYYGVASDWHRTQVEALAGLPLFLSLAIFSRSDDEPGTVWAGCLAGVCSAAALIFKLAFLPLALGPVLLCLIHRWRAGSRIFDPMLLSYFISLLAVLGATALYYSAVGAGPMAFDANFLYPGNLLRQYPPASHFMRIRGALLWFLKSFLPLIGLAGASLFFRPAERNRLFSLQLWYWLFMGVFVIWLQFFSHWAYHFFLLFIPVLMLASLGLDELCLKLSFAKHANDGLLRAYVVGALVLISIVPIASMIRRSVLLAKNDFALSDQGRIGYYSVLSTNSYGSIVNEVAFLNAQDSLPGDVLVIGNPLYYTLSGRTQAGVENGWAPDLMLLKNRQQMISDLTARPAAYVLIEGEFETGIVKQRFGDLLDLLQKRYDVVRSSPSKTWYRLRATASNQSSPR